MAKLKEGDEVAFRVNPMGAGYVMGVGKVVKPGDRVTSIVVNAVQKTPYITEGQGLSLANTMIFPITALNSCDALSIIDSK